MDNEQAIQQILELFTCNENDNSVMFKYRDDTSLSNAGYPELEKFLIELILLKRREQIARNKAWFEGRKDKNERL